MFEETRGIRFELLRHFLATLFDSEMLSGRGGWLTVAVSAFGLAIPAGILLLHPPGGPPLPGGPPAALALVIPVTGILAVLAWQSLFPARSDCLALAGLPARPRHIFEARFLTVLLVAAVLTGVMTVLPVLLPLDEQRPLARAACSGVAALFVFFAIVALQGVLLNVLPAKLFARVSTWVQGGLLGGFVLCGITGGYGRATWFSSVAHLRAEGLWAAAGAIALAGLTYFAAYRRYRRLLLEAPEIAPRRGRTLGLLRLLARDPRRQAVLMFIAEVLGRSRIHRLVPLCYAGAGLAIMINSVLLMGGIANQRCGWRGELAFIALYWPAGLAVALLAGIRHAFKLPVSLPANWMFRITESQGRREWMSAVERFVIGCVIVPIELAAVAAAAVVLEWPVALRMATLQTLALLIVFEILFYDWQQLPFTCSYIPGKRPLAATAGIWIGVLSVLLPVLAIVIAAISELREIFLLCAPFFATVWLWMRRRRRDGWGEVPLIYEDRDELVADLGLRGTPFARERVRPVTETSA